MRFFSLSDDLIFKILINLVDDIKISEKHSAAGSHRILAQVACVSRRLRVLSNLPQLWHTLQLRVKDSTQQQMFTYPSTVTRCFGIEHLSITPQDRDTRLDPKPANFSWLTDGFICQLHVLCPNLKSLTIQGPSLSLPNLKVSDYMRIVKPDFRFPYLKKLVIREAHNVLEMCIYCPKLVDLQVNVCFKLLTLRLEPTMQNQLTKLDLDGVRLRHDSLENLLGDPALRTLTKLRLGYHDDVFQLMKLCPYEYIGNREFVITSRTLEIIGRSCINLELLELLNPLRICIWDIAPILIGCTRLRDLKLAWFPILLARSYLRKREEFLLANPGVRCRNSLMFEYFFGKPGVTAFPSLQSLTMGCGIHVTAPRVEDLVSSVLMYLPNLDILHIVEEGREHIGMDKDLRIFNAAQASCGLDYVYHTHRRMLCLKSPIEDHPQLCRLVKKDRKVCRYKILHGLFQCPYQNPKSSSTASSESPVCIGCSHDESDSDDFSDSENRSEF